MLHSLKIFQSTKLQCHEPSCNWLQLVGKNRGLGAGVKVRGKIIVDKRGMGGGRGKNKRWQVKVGWKQEKKWESTQHCLLLCHQKRGRKGNKLRKKGQGRDARYIRYILRGLDPLEPLFPHSSSMEKITCSYCHYLIICCHQGQWSWERLGAFSGEIPRIILCIWVTDHLPLP